MRPSADRRPLSPEDLSTIQALEEAFASVPRPEHFTNFTHCDECAEHDETLRSRDRETLQRSDLGNGGWDPITFATPQGFAYYFPALARIALDDDPSGRTSDWYMAMLLSQLAPHYTYEERKGYLKDDQRRAIAAFLAHVLATREHQLKYESELDSARRALDAWEEHAV